MQSRNIFLSTARAVATIFVAAVLIFPALEVSPDEIRRDHIWSMASAHNIADGLLTVQIDPDRETQEIFFGGVSAFHAKDYDNALQLLEQITIDPNYTDGTTPGMPEANLIAGLIHYNGLGESTSSDKQRASQLWQAGYKFLESAVKSKDKSYDQPLSIHYLGHYNLRGLAVGLTPNYEDAAKRFREAAFDVEGQKTVFAPSAYSLGDLFVDGCVQTSHRQDGVKWYRIAASNGYPKANFQLARLFKKGELVPRDNSFAMAHYKVADEAGYPVPQEELISLQTGMSAFEINVVPNIVKRIRYSKPIGKDGPHERIKNTLFSQEWGWNSYWPQQDSCQ